MLQTPSHLTRACGQSHYKKFWLMQTQTESQDNCSVSSPPARSFPVAILKGSDGKVSGNPASRSFTTEIAPQGRGAWPIVGSSDAGFGGMSNAHRSNVSLSTCAESLRLQQPDASSSRLSRLPSEDCLVVMDANDSSSPDVAEPRRSSGLSAPFYPCVSPSPTLFSIPGQVLNESTSREIGFQEVGIPLVGSASEKDLPDIPSGSIQRKCQIFTANVQDASEDYTCSTGSDSCVRGELFSEASAQENAFKYAIDSPSVSSATKRCVESNNSSPQENPGEVNAQFGFLGNGEIQECSPLAFVEQHEEYMADPPGLCAGRNVLRTCKLCGTTKTPLWRSGPQGPKSLCNACGIRFKKLKRSQAARECQVEVSRPTTPTSTKFSSLPLKRKSVGDKEHEAVKGRSHQRFKRSAYPTWMVARRNPTPKVEDTESCLTSPGTPSPRKQISNMSRASIRRKESAAKLALLENQSRLTSVLAADVKEAAVLLMALSCGLVLA